MLQWHKHEIGKIDCARADFIGGCIMVLSHYDKVRRVRVEFVVTIVDGIVNGYPFVGHGLDTLISIMDQRIDDYLKYNANGHGASDIGRAVIYSTKAFGGQPLSERTQEEREAIVILSCQTQD